MSVMTSFKRKRIERWCEDVAYYLNNGTICKAVIGNIAEDAIRGAAMVSKETTNDTLAPSRNANNAIQNGGATSGGNNLNAKVDLALKKATQALASNDGYFSRENLVNGITNGSAVIPTASSAVPGNSFPVVKFAYSHYHEQRRKIDRLVQGLPVLTANGVSTFDRPSSKTSTEDHVPIIIVNGEEPVRSSHTRSRSSSQPRRDQACRTSSITPSSHVNNINNNGVQQLPNPQNPLESTSLNFRHQNQSAPSPLRRHDSGGGRLYDFRSPGNCHVGVTVDPGLALTANDRISRIKTAPAPNRNLHRARQRILTRRGNRILEPPSQIPLQNCWAMAELTW